MPTPKLVIVAGSNALAGIDAQILGERLSVHVFNFGLSASLGPGLQTFESEKILRPGDAALLPLEYTAYDYETPENSLVDAVYTCGTDYLRSLSWREKLFFVLAVRPQRILDSLLFRSQRGAMRMTAALAARDVGPYGQRPGGNFPLHQVAIDTGLAAEPLLIHLRGGGAGAKAIASFVAWAHARRIAVLATWPNTIDLPQAASDRGFARIREFYARLGVAMVGAPRDAMLPARLMGDRFYHPNRAGMAVRTERLVQLLRGDAAFCHWRQAGLSTVSSVR
ncbi:MAG TPA: hypothetical protein VMF67_00580 [Rhizomicrobium sp.]|nr:hypothetical protein [Rhizomicrobium sp.]